MKKMIALFFLMLPYTLFSAESQFNTCFNQRFGPNSPSYNEPLYFATDRITSSQKPIKRKYRRKVGCNQKQLQKNRKDRLRRLLGNRPGRNHPVHTFHAE